MRSRLCRIQSVCFAFVLLLGLNVFSGFDILSHAQAPDLPPRVIPPEGKSQDPAVTLSPEAWEEGELEKYTTLQNTFSPSHPVAEGNHGMVSATDSALAVRSGFEALKQGGTAADAAMTTALAQIALFAGSVTSYAGFMCVTYYDAAEHQVTYMNAAYNTPLYEEDPRSIPSDEPSGRTALVPGFFAGLEAVHQAFGKLPFKTIFEPAIYFAEEGFELNELLGYYIDYRKDVLSRLPETQAIFTKENGEFYSAGDWFRQPVLAETLKKVADQGSKYIYQGEWAQRFVNAVQADGGKITMEDMQHYREIWSDPLRTTYGQYEIFAPGLPSNGGVNTVEALNLLDISDLRNLGLYSESPEAFFWFSQIYRMYVLSFMNSETLAFLADYDLSLESRAKRETSIRLWNDMKNGDFLFTTVPNQDLLFSRFPSRNLSLIELPEPCAATHSDSIVAVDQWGNIASVTHTINTTIWGQTGIFVGGISIPDSASFQQTMIGDTGPGNRLPDPTNPLIVFRNDQPYLASSTIGNVHYRLIAPLYHMLEYDKDVDEAFEAPFLLSPDFSGFLWFLPMAGRSIRERVIKGDFDNWLIHRTRWMGLKIDPIPVEYHTSFRGYWVAIRIDPETGSLKGVTSEILNGAALGY